MLQIKRIFASIKLTFGRVIYPKQLIVTTKWKQL